MFTPTDMRHRLIFTHAYLRKQIHRHIFTDTIHGHRTQAYNTAQIHVQRHIFTNTIHGHRTQTCTTTQTRIHGCIFIDISSQTQRTDTGQRHISWHRHIFAHTYHSRTTQTQDTDTGIKHISRHIQHHTHDTTRDTDTQRHTFTDTRPDIDTFTPTPAPTLSHIPARFAGWRNSAIPTLPPFPRAFLRLLLLFLLLLLAVLFRDPLLREYRALLRKYRALLREYRALLGDMVMEGWEEGTEKRSHLFEGSFVQMYRADLWDHGAVLSYTLMQSVLEE